MPFLAGLGAADPPARTAAESACAPGRAGPDQPAQPPGLVLPLTGILHAETVLQYIGKGQCAVLLSRFQCFLQGNDHTISALPAKMHPQLICYPLPSALWDGKENPPLSRNDASTSKWIFWSRESGSFFLLQRVSCEGCGLTPLYILQVTLAGPRTTVEAQAFYRMYHSYADIPNPWDRLRWCRYGLDLLQKEVAAMVGMEEWLYQDLESGIFHRSFTPELADKLAALYGIPVEDILDDYTLFLHRGGGAFLRRYREAKGWNRQQLADHAKVGRTSIRCWETGQKTISQKCFRLLAENLGPDFLSMLRM